MHSGEYQTAKQFLLYVAGRVYGEAAVPEMSSFISDLENRRMALARKSVAMGLADIFAATAMWPSKTRSTLDKELASISLPTFSEMRIKHWSKYKTIVTRGKIRNEDEFYMVKAIFEDTEEGSPEDRSVMARMLSDYEQV